MEEYTDIVEAARREHVKVCEYIEREQILSIQLSELPRYQFLKRLHLKIKIYRINQFLKQWQKKNKF